MYSLSAFLAENTREMIFARAKNFAVEIPRRNFFDAVTNTKKTPEYILCMRLFS